MRGIFMTPELQNSLNFIIAECEEIIRLGEAATKGPWTPCNASDQKCQCGMIWGEGFVVAAGMSAKEHEYTGGEGFTHEQRCYNCAFITRSRSITPKAARATITAIKSMMKIVQEDRCDNDGRSCCNEEIAQTT